MSLFLLPDGPPGRRSGLACLFFAALASAAAAELPPLPQGLASFGAATSGHYLYVYGGHTGATHVHSADDQSRRFLRLDLEAPTAWEDLGEGDALQGLALVPWQDGVCRIGGMMARNRRGQPEDLVSVAEVFCWSAATRRWTALPALPAPRSSHDAVVVGDRIYVAGGWRLPGQGAKGVWADDLLIFANGAWRQVAQPFSRRALATVATSGKLWAIGGIDLQGTSSRVDVFDLASESWSVAAKLPYVGDLDGFGAAAVGTPDGILLSASDGIVQALPAAPEGAWRDVGIRWQEHRFFHRLLTYRDSLLAVAGATPHGHTATLEQQPLPRFDTPSAVAQAASPPSPVAAPFAGWPGFRGHGDGQAGTAALPTTAALAWRQDVPGYGQSSPIVWGDQVLLTSVVGENKEELLLSAFELGSGEVRWRRRFATSLRLEAKATASRAAPTPVADSERIYAFFESGDLIALDHRGETLWRRALALDYGVFEGNHGLASSPVLSGEVVVVQVTHAGPSYLLGVAAASGKTLWKHDLPAKVAWTTPLVLPGEPAQVIVSANGRLEALDAGSGELIFHLAGLDKNVSASPVLAGDLLVVPGAEVATTVAVRLGGRGELGPEAILWRAEDTGVGFASPVFAGGCLIVVNKSGVAACLDPGTGVSRWQERLGDEVWASPVVAGDRVFFFSKKGQRLVYQVGLEGARRLAFEELATEDVVYGVAAAPAGFVLRTGHQLLRLAAPVEAAAPAVAAAP